MIPRHEEIVVPPNLDETVIPAFAFIHGRYPYGIGTPASIANNYRTAIKIHSYGGHTFSVMAAGEIPPSLTEEITEGA